MLKDSVKKYKDLTIEFIEKLKGADRRIALAKVAKAEGKGGQSRIAEELQVSRDTIRKGHHEWETGLYCEDAFHTRGRKKAEDYLPGLLQDIRDIVDGHSQTDPNFHTTRLFTRITVEEIRHQLIERKGYEDEALPSNQTLNTKINELGYRLTKVEKVKPLKKIEETDDIFHNLDKVHADHQGQSNVVRFSIDTKDRVKIGPFSRGGKSRTNTQAVDHDFGNDHITPFGILDVTNDHVDITFTDTKATADLMIDCIEAYWLKQDYHHYVDTLIINADNGPENNSRRTQFMKRIIAFAVEYDVKVILAYYPPYHSKYNPVERVWGLLEQHWNGALLDTTEAVLGFAESMTWKSNNPWVTLAQNIYETGKKVSQKVMEEYEKVIERTQDIEKWAVEIDPQQCKWVVQLE